MEKVDAPKTVGRSAVNFFVGTALSRSFGFLREIALSAWFGATPLLAAFFVAYRFSQLLRRLFGESSLLSSFSPHFEELRISDPEKAASFFRDLFASLSVLLGVLILILEAGLFSWWKWGGAYPDTQEILMLTMIMLPGVFFVCLYALFAALLQSNRKYFLPSAAPLFFNVVFLLVLWSVKDWAPQEATVVLAVGVVFAFLIQWLVVASGTTTFLKKIDWRAVQLWGPLLRKMVSAMGLTIIGIGSTQVNSFIDTLFARSADLAGPAYLYYAIRLYQLPLALFGIALSSALLPPLARALQLSDRNHFVALLQYALRKCLFFMIPITCALFVFGESLVNVVYGHGAFDSLATLETTYCLWGYGIGLIPSALILLFAPAFYAQKDFKTPLKASLISIAINMGLNALFIYGFMWGPSSVAVATSIASIVNAIYLVKALSAKAGQIINGETSWMIKKVTICSVFAGFVTTLVGYFLVGGGAAYFLMSGALLPRDLVTQVTHLALYAGVFALFFFSYVGIGKKVG
jgi:putative peptidoglycan lipid II flippase